MRILIIEDEIKIANSLKKGLEQESFAADVAYSGSEGFDLAATEPYDLIIMDRMLPEIDGVAIIQKLRSENIHTPILMLTAKGQLVDKIAGFTAGADDYLVKPFAFEELLARVRALTRRPKETLSLRLSIDDLELDNQAFTVTRAGKTIKLSAKEYALLEYLLRHKQKIVTKKQIIDHVWDYHADVLPNTVEVYIGYLRNKIDKQFPQKKPLIHTMRGFGYTISTKNT